MTQRDSLDLYNLCRKGTPEQIVDFLKEKSYEICELNKPHGWQKGPSSCICYLPLMEAVEEGNIDVIQFLLKNGADPDIPDWRDRTPREVAAAKNLSQVFEKLRPVVNIKP